MSSTREQVLGAVLSLIATALPDTTVRRNQEAPQSIPAGGMVIIRDGDPGDPAVDLSPQRYNYEHRIPVEVAGFLSATLTNEAVLDALLSPIGAAVASNRTLGGLVDFLEVSAPVSDDFNTPTAGRWAEIALVAAYATDTPLS